jgi:CRISPR-associated endonuclease/helicase Cas3
MSTKVLNELDRYGLLAKSLDNGKWRDSAGLIGHTADVVNSVTAIIDVLGEALIKQFGLNCDFNTLRSTARLAAYLHDWGKANHHFQQVVRKQRNPLESPQMFRHEVISLLIAWEYKEWLEQCPDADFMIALAAAGGHHLKLGGKAGKQNDDLGEYREGTGDDRLYLYLTPQYFRPLLKYGVKQLNLPPKLPQRIKSLLKHPPNCWTISEIKQRRNQLLDEFIDWQPDPVFLALIKAILIAGDAAGSGLPNAGKNIKQWIDQELAETLTLADLEKIIDKRRGKHDLRDFQLKLGATNSRVTLARAGCGTGKTLGAYVWAKKYAVGRKLWFCYPTTGTSTEGFIDYVHGEVEGVLFHSRSAVDLERIQLNSIASTGEEADNGGELTLDENGKLIQSFENETDKKLDSFKAWGKKVIVCTVDTVLGLLQCNRRPMYCFPAIAQGAFVFDEVHCYDDALFGALLRFLETVKAPILLMSASFLPWQIEAIEKAVGEPINIIQGPQEIEVQPRYNFHYLDAPDWERVENELKNDGKVLWVCNQVNTAIDVYREAKRRKLNAVLYHSRYIYRDREKHHRAVVDGFKEDKPIIAIATQVAEMSLDLSATLLVSQIADPAGLIQRLGRLNRKYCGRALDAIFYPDPKVRFPYSQEDLDNGKALVDTFSKDVNQAELANWLENLATRGNPRLDTVLLDKKWRTYPASLRLGGHNITALLEHITALLERDKKRSHNLANYTVPLPARNISKWERHKKGYLIAPASEWDYSAELGATEIKQVKS